MTGKLALSKAGHDKNTLYLIIKEEQDMLYLSDGCGRDLLHPKKKNRSSRLRANTSSRIRMAFCWAAEYFFSIP